MSAELARAGVFKRAGEAIAGGVSLAACCLTGLAFAAEGQGGPAAAVRLVVEGKATAVVVTAQEPLPGARYAADELVRHVKLATGVTLPVATEAAVPAGYASRVFLGMTRAARAQGIAAEKLPREGFVMRSAGPDLYLVGEEDSGDPLSPNNPKCGTLFGVYEFAETVLGARWLWPGELGTYVPRAKTVEVPAVDRTLAPALRFRELGWSGMRRVLGGGRREEQGGRHMAALQGAVVPPGPPQQERGGTQGGTPGVGAGQRHQAERMIFLGAVPGPEVEHVDREQQADPDGERDDMAPCGKAYRPRLRAVAGCRGAGRGGCRGGSIAHV